MTREDQSEMDRAAYRAGCTYRRNKSVIEVKDSDGWHPYQGYASINAAKRAARGPIFAGRIYTVA